MPKIKFINEKKEIEVPAGSVLRDVAKANGVPLHHHGLGAMPTVGEYASSMASVVNCMGFGLCGTCHVYVKAGKENCSPPGVVEKVHMGLSTQSIGHEEEFRLSCQTKVMGDIEVETRPNSNFFGEAFWQ